MRSLLAPRMEVVEAERHPQEHQELIGYRSKFLMPSHRGLADFLLFQKGKRVALGTSWTILGPGADQSL